MCTGEGRVVYTILSAWLLVLDAGAGPGPVGVLEYPSRVLGFIQYVRVCSGDSFLPALKFCGFAVALLDGERKGGVGIDRTKKSDSQPKSEKTRTPRGRPS